MPPRARSLVKPFAHEDKTQDLKNGAMPPKPRLRVGVQEYRQWRPKEHDPQAPEIFQELSPKVNKPLHFLCAFFGALPGMTRSTKECQNFRTDC